MKLKTFARIPDVIKLLVLLAIPLTIVTVGAYYHGEDVSNVLGVFILFYSFIALYISSASLVQKFVFDRLDIVLKDYANLSGLTFVPHGYSMWANPGEGSGLNGKFKEYTISLRGYFHGYQLGRKSFVVEVDSIKSPSMLLLASNKHKFPKLDFWNYGKIPSFSSFLCEQGPLVKLKQPHVLKLPEYLVKTHYLVAEDQDLATKILKQLPSKLSNLTGAIYLDGEKMYYGQKKLPSSMEELGQIVDSVTDFASSLNNLSKRGGSL